MNAASHAPRLVIAGLAGDSGKSVVSMALLRALRQAGTEVRAFKKGPDYIDAAWLAWAAGGPARNLDSWLMGFSGAVQSFCAHAIDPGLNLVEGNRGLFDGVDVAGTHSTAELAKAIGAPVLLVLNVAKMTRTAAAVVLGCQHLDPDLAIAGVVLNHVNGKRHETIVRDAIERVCGIPVVGVVPKLASDALPARHLGLVTPEDHPAMRQLPSLLDKIAARLDMRRITRIAAAVNPLGSPPLHPAIEPPEGREVRIAVVQDAAFSFYYQENFEALSRAGATLVFISALRSAGLPEDVDAVYIGGGFPEVHAATLEANAGFLHSLADAAARGLPVYAECGGLMLLSRSIRWQGRGFRMAGVLPVDIDVDSAPQGHGYVEMMVDSPNPFYDVGTVLRGHEFHYSRIAVASANASAPFSGESAMPRSEPPPTVCAVSRGTGAFAKRDGLIVNHVWASYTHLHAGATPEWAEGVIELARRHRALCSTKRNYGACRGLRQGVNLAGQAG
jgi:cobyrinic acid a,c-diamide synthase